MKPKILVILGQTATGKSDVAVNLAKKFKGEVISADSRQVYKGLDIGTGKITKKEMSGVHHYLLDVADPKKQFSVAEYKKQAEEKIYQILKRGKIPIITGGTGFYIDAVLNDITLPKVPPDPALRKKLAKLSVEELFKKLKDLDPKRAGSIDRKNKVRLIRAIEIAKALGKVPQLKSYERFNAFKIGLKMHPEILKVKIKYRLLKRIEMGMIKEVIALRKKGLSWFRMHELGLEYRYVALFLQKKIKREEMIEGLSNAIWHYAKRQNTWFKRDKNIHWFDPASKSDLKKAEILVKKFIA